MQLTEGLHWRQLDPDTHLGYRKGKRGGRWLLRYYVGSGTYRQQTIGTADDIISEGTFTYDEACRLARRKVIEARQLVAIQAAGPVPTVKTAIASYIERCNARASAIAGRPIRSGAAGRLSMYVLANSELSDTPLHQLSDGSLRNWLKSLNCKSGATRKRISNDFRAALNSAADEGRRVLPADLPVTIKHGFRYSEEDAVALTQSSSKGNQILSDKEVRWIIEAAKQTDFDGGWEGDLLRMILLLGATGARFSQVRRIRVQDVQIIASRIMIPSSAKGRKRDARYIPVPLGADVLAALQPVMRDRDKMAPLLEKWHNVQIGPGKWRKSERRAWRASYEITKPFKAIAEIAGLSGRTAYCLRHSSIVRHLRIGTPIRLVAALHDTSVEMIERHYSYWIADGLEDIAARAVVPLISFGAIDTRFE
ncbi:tyrosine-type recombinase/integrase [Asticcacaulis sp. MM231]|uniref:tyrosine-type recombinase/integrase n=1 Tax=Asticcacaulis sp. MM231 TaxID=3157666 RepID=UPI0032D5999E